MRVEDLKKLDRQILYLEEFQKNVMGNLKTVVSDYAKRSMNETVRNLGLGIKLLYSKRETERI